MDVILGDPPLPVDIYKSVHLKCLANKIDDCVTISVVCAVIKKRTGSIKGLLIKDYATIVNSCGLGVIRRDNDETVWATRFVVVL